MIRNLTRWIFVAMALTSINGCRPVCDGTSPPKPALVVIVNDGSGTFAHFEDALNYIAPKEQDQYSSKGLVGALKRHDVVAYQLITAEAKEEDTVIEPTAVDYNQYDSNEKTKWRQNFSTRLWATPSPQTYGTDINGALYRAGLILSNANYAGFDRYLLVFSDLGETQNLSYEKTDLAGAKVKVLYYSPTLALEKKESYAPDSAAWKDRMKSFGASSVEIIDADNSALTNPFK